MNNKVLIPILVVAVIAIIVVVAFSLTKEETSTNTTTTVTNTAVDPLQAEEADLDNLSNTINAQTGDEAVIPELESTLTDLESNSATEERLMTQR